jgi:hypothetical protein
MTITALRNEAPQDVTNGPGPEPGEGRWSNTEILLAAQLDEQRRSSWAYLAAHSKKRPPYPDPVPRPGVLRAGRRDEKPRYSLERALMIDPRLRAQHEAQMRAKEGG